VGGSTFGFDVWPGHPEYDNVIGLLRSLRARTGPLRMTGPAQMAREARAADLAREPAPITRCRAEHCVVDWLAFPRAAARRGRMRLQPIEPVRKRRVSPLPNASLPRFCAGSLRSGSTSMGTSF
jgi:hypothetical protein